MVLVDTSAWIEMHRLKGDAAVKLAVRGLPDEFQAALCGPVEMELLGGARPDERERLQAWCNILPYTPNDQKIRRKAATNFAILKSRGSHRALERRAHRHHRHGKPVRSLRGGQTFHSDGGDPPGAEAVSFRLRRNA